MAQIEAGLDAQELMHLALKAMEQDRHEDVLLFLKQALVQEPEEGRLHYLQAAGTYTRSAARRDRRSCSESRRAAARAAERVQAKPGQARVAAPGTLET